MLYPLLLTQITKKMIWGREDWITTCRPQEMSIIKNGKFKGESLESYISKDKTAVLGEKFADCVRFPLLIKIIHADDTLSVQVHPDDDYAIKTGGESGKNEMWQILKPPHDGNLIIGLKPGTTKESFAQAIKKGNDEIENFLNRLQVKTGDMVNIPAGLVHALTPGAVILEAQQNSDITYRLYDYGRVGVDGKPRELHTADALNVINFETEGTVTQSVNTEFFKVSGHVVNARKEEKSNPFGFHILVCTEGLLNIVCGDESLELSEGNCVFIPAGLGAYEINPVNGHGVYTKISG